jgi:hypothetical protein
LSIGRQTVATFDEHLVPTVHPTMHFKLASIKPSLFIESIHEKDCDSRCFNKGLRTTVLPFLHSGIFTTMFDAIKTVGGFTKDPSVMWCHSNMFNTEAHIISGAP